MTENAGGASLTESSPSVADFVSGLMNDFPMSDTESAPAGAPPATTPEEQSTVDSSEGTDPSVEVSPDATPPEPDAAAPTPEADPFEGSSPLSYVVNGQERQAEGITVLKDGGAIIDPEALEKVQRVFGERDHLYERAQEQHQRSEALSKLIEWTPPGQQKALQGSEAVQALHLSRAELMAEVRAFQTLLSDPENIRKIVTADESGKLVWNDQGVENFRLALQVKQNELRSAVGKWFADRQATTAQPAQFDPQSLASTATAKAVESLGAAAKGWTAADKAWAEQLAPRFIRQATLEDQRANPALVVGAPMVEQQFLDLVADRAGMRAGTAQVATTAADAAKANAAKIAAAKTGQRPTNAPKITPTKEPERTREDDQSDAWDRQQRAAAGALRAHVSGIK